MKTTQAPFKSIFDISASFKAVLIDIYGVFWGGNQKGLLKDSQEAMRRLVREGYVVGILSNSTKLVESEVKKFEKHGLFPEMHFHFLLTSGQITRELALAGSLPFASPNKKFYLFGSAHPQFLNHRDIFHQSGIFETAEIDKADFIYIGVPQIAGEDQTDPALFAQEVALLSEINLPVLCANPDTFAHEGDPPRAVVRQGSIAELFEKSGKKVHYIGKPYPMAYKAAMEAFASRKIYRPADILMVGDTPETDIRGANLVGMFSALVTQTGNMGDRVAQGGLERALELLKEEDYPHYLIERLA